MMNIVIGMNQERSNQDDVDVVNVMIAMNKERSVFECLTGEDYSESLKVSIEIDDWKRFFCCRKMTLT